MRSYVYRTPSRRRRIFVVIALLYCLVILAILFFYIHRTAAKDHESSAACEWRVFLHYVRWFFSLQVTCSLSCYPAHDNKMIEIVAGRGKYYWREKSSLYKGENEKEAAHHATDDLETFRRSVWASREIVFHCVMTVKIKLWLYYYIAENSVQQWLPWEFWLWLTIRKARSAVMRFLHVCNCKFTCTQFVLSLYFSNFLISLEITLHCA